MSEQNDVQQMETASPPLKWHKKIIKDEYLPGLLFFFVLAVIQLASMVVYSLAHGINYFRLWTDPTLTFQVDFIGGKKNAFSMGMEISVWTFWGVSCRTAYTALKAMLKGKFRFFKYLVIWCGTVGFAWGVSVALIFSLSVVTFTVGATKVTLADASIEMLMAVAFIIGFYNEWALKMLEQVRDQLTGGLEGEPPKK